jgi:lipoprotein-releasing system permease protein
LLIAFNLIGSLWMIVLEKKRDISILKSLGATAKHIRNLFLQEGLLICLLGISIGIIAALLLYTAQKQFGLVSIPEGFIIDAYPIKLKGTDIIVVIITVFLIGLLASFPSSIRASKISAYVREE